MGRISDIIPPLYYDAQNDLIRFTDCLDFEVKELEHKVRGITDLVNVDKCPDDKLPYLATITNCPLMGNDPALWRRQIKNWPYLLKIKGTALSLDVFLNSIDVDEHKIYTFFRDAQGNLVEEKPEGEPFKDSSGVWHNIRTHYFDLDIIYGNEHYLTWSEWHGDFLRSINIWLERAKPFHSELRKLNVILQRNEDIHLFVGTGTFQGTHHDIDFVQRTSGTSVLGISIGTGTFQTSTHDIAIIQRTHSETSHAVSVGAGIIQGGHHDIAHVQGISSSSDMGISVGTAAFHTYKHDVNIVQETQAEGTSSVHVGAGVTVGAVHDVAIVQKVSGHSGLNMSFGAGIMQNIAHEVSIQQSTHGKGEAKFFIGGTVGQSSNHDVNIQQKVSGSATINIPVGFHLLHEVGHDVKLNQQSSADATLGIPAGTAERNSC